MGDCDGVTRSEHRRSLLLTAFDLVTVASLRDLEPYSWKCVRGEADPH